jgi:hypothetical protein
MDDYQPLWAEPHISMAMFVAVGDQLLCETSWNPHAAYHEVVKRELASGVLVFHIQDGSRSMKIVKQTDDSIAYKKRLE